jgi:UPF0755 protein
MRFSIFGVFKTVVVLVILGALGVVGYSAYSKVPEMINDLLTIEDSGPKEIIPGEEVVVEIPKGASLSQVGGVLERKGVISSKLVFKLVAMIRGEQRKIKAGEYVLKTDQDEGDVLDLLIKGDTRTVSITIPEGYNIFQIAGLFDQWGFMPRAEFLKLASDKKFLKEIGVKGPSLEGFLFPDTYFLKVSERRDAKQLIKRMVKRFQDVYDNNVKTIAEKNGWSRLQVVTLASLIEKEARAKEHQLVSAVFHNRLRKNMLIQSDPTVIYGVKPMGAKITKKDLKSKHPYNTYTNPGLPPGPIANPGKASLVAAVKPANVNYLYFVAKNDGTHHFSPTLREHINNVNLYQRSGKGRSRNN